MPWCGVNTLHTSSLALRRWPVIEGKEESVLWKVGRRYMIGEKYVHTHNYTYMYMYVQKCQAVQLCTCNVEKTVVMMIVYWQLGVDLFLHATFLCYGSSSIHLFVVVYNTHILIYM